MTLDLLLDPPAGAAQLHLVDTPGLTGFRVTQESAAMATRQLFGTLVVAGAQSGPGLVIGCS